MTLAPLDRLDEAVAPLGAAVSAAEPTLTALDVATGDGDFGTNVDHGFARVAEVLAGDADASPWATLQTVFLDEVGGTSGPLFGLLFQSLGAAAASEDAYLRALAVGLRAGLDAIQRVGEAEVGDRTMVDALAPAVQTIEDQADAVAMVRAAVDGALGTASRRARRGRSSYVGERALGHADPGAVGIALLLTVVGEPEVGPEVAASERARLLDGARA